MTKVCLGANTLGYPTGGGHMWAYLNWALSLRAAGCEVSWLECVEDPFDLTDVEALVGSLSAELARHGLGDALVLWAPGPETALPAPRIEAAADADLLLDLAYLPDEVTARFRRSALIDIDPGMTQLWGAEGDLELSAYHIYFTIGGAVGTDQARVPDCGVRWHYTPPCVALEAWPAVPASPDAPYTTVAHWWEADAGLDIDGEWVDNSKRASFLEFLDLPERTDVRFELALGGLEDEEERRMLQAHGWRVSDAWQITPTPAAFQSFVQRSRGEFSCAKPAYVRLQVGWISDRTICYLASGRPAIVQDTGPSRVKGGEGLLRFATLDQASRALARVEGDYPHHCQSARQLAEERFDGRQVASSVLDRALT